MLQRVSTLLFILPMSKPSLHQGALLGLFGIAYYIVMIEIYGFVFSIDALLYPTVTWHVINHAWPSISV